MRRRLLLGRDLMRRYEQVLLKFSGYLVRPETSIHGRKFWSSRRHFDNYAGLLCFFISFNNSSANVGSTSLSISYCALASLYLPLPKYKVASSKPPMTVGLIFKLSSNVSIMVLARLSQAIESPR